MPPQWLLLPDLTEEQKKVGIAVLWWEQYEQKFPISARVARRSMVKQAAESDVERNYSHAGHIFEKKRASLSDKTLHMILFLYENRSYWENLTDDQILAIFAEPQEAPAVAPQ
jgi:hypothetical protein